MSETESETITAFLAEIKALRDQLTEKDRINQILAEEIRQVRLMMQEIQEK